MPINRPVWKINISFYPTPFSVLVTSLMYNDKGRGGDTSRRERVTVRVSFLTRIIILTPFSTFTSPFLAPNWSQVIGRRTVKNDAQTKLVHTLEFRTPGIGGNAQRRGGQPPHPLSPQLACLRIYHSLTMRSREGESWPIGDSGSTATKQLRLITATLGSIRPDLIHSCD